MLHIEPLQDFYCHDKAVSCLEFSPTSPSMFASGGQDNIVGMWDVLKVADEQTQDPEDEKYISPPLILQHTCHDNCVDDISWSPTLLNTLLSVDQDRSVHLWKPAPELCRDRLFDPDEEVPDALVE